MNEMLKPLLEKVYAKPDEDGPRLDYAQELKKTDEAQAELIELQLRDGKGQTSAKEKKKIASLLKKNWKAWVGELAPVLYFESSVFSRGFLETAFIAEKSKGKANWNAIVGNPILQTVRAYGGWHSSPDGASILFHPVLRHLQQTNLFAKELDAFPVEVPWQLQKLTLEVRGELPPQHLDLLQRHPAFARLAELNLSLRSAVQQGSVRKDQLMAVRDEVLKHPLGARLTRLGVDVRDYDLGSAPADWLTGWLTVPDAPPALKLLSVRGRALYMLPRQNDQEWNSLEIASAGSDIGEIAAVLKAIPKGRIAALTVRRPEPMIPDFHQTLVLAAEALGPLKLLRLPEVRAS